MSPNILHGVLDLDSFVMEDIDLINQFVRHGGGKLIRLAYFLKHIPECPLDLGSVLMLFLHFLENGQGIRDACHFRIEPLFLCSHLLKIHAAADTLFVEAALFCLQIKQPGFIRGKLLGLRRKAVVFFLVPQEQKKLIFDRIENSLFQFAGPHGQSIAGHIRQFGGIAAVVMNMISFSCSEKHMIAVSADHFPFQKIVMGNLLRDREVVPLFVYLPELFSVHNGGMLAGNLDPFAFIPSP